jgi:hypothetical protein
LSRQLSEEESGWEQKHERLAQDHELTL